MKYKNIVFDFGNVIGKFNGRDLVKHFSSCEEDQELLFTLQFFQDGMILTMVR